MLLPPLLLSKQHDTTNTTHAYSRTPFTAHLLRLLRPERCGLDQAVSFPLVDSLAPYIIFRCQILLTCTPSGATFRRGAVASFPFLRSLAPRIRVYTTHRMCFNANKLSPAILFLLPGLPGTRLLSNCRYLFWSAIDLSRKSDTLERTVVYQVYGRYVYIITHHPRDFNYANPAHLLISRAMIQQCEDIAVEGRVD